MATKQIQNLKERMYKDVIDLAVSLKSSGKTMTGKELLDWINKHYQFPHPYGNIRNVPSAAHRRAKSSVEIAAVENVFVDEFGTPLPISK